MKSIQLHPNTTYLQLMVSGKATGNRSNVWVVVRKRNGEVGEIKFKGNKPHDFTSLARATQAYRKLVKQDGQDSGWCIITSDELARSNFVWL
jgi:hypothetical protein